MPSNNTGSVVKNLFKQYPDKIALLLNPHNLKPHHFQFNYAIDNAAFAQFDERKYFDMLDYSKQFQPPIFIVVPDVVGCHARTLALWKYYYHRVLIYGYKMAFVAQDGCRPEDIPVEADFIFIGGNDPWKMNNVHRFIDCGRPVHVGRVNTMNRLKKCEDLGVYSVDGTGWMRFRGSEFNGLMDWFAGVGSNQVQLKCFM